MGNLQNISPFEDLPHCNRFVWLVMIDLELPDHISPVFNKQRLPPPDEGRPAIIYCIASCLGKARITKTGTKENKRPGDKKTN